MTWRTKPHFLLAIIDASMARQHLGASASPRLVLGWLRETLGDDLESLAAHTIDAQVRAAVAAINADPATSEDVALTHGL